MSNKDFNKDDIESLGAVGFIILLGILFFGAFGYVRNIVRLAHTDFEAPYKAEILRGAGILVLPVGIIEGYIKINDGK